MRLITKYQAGGVTIPDWVLRHFKTIEGFRKDPYKDAGKYSYGYGSQVDINGKAVTAQTAPITESQAAELLKKRLQSIYSQISGKFSSWSKMPEQTRWGLVDAAYRGGSGIYNAPKSDGSGRGGSYGFATAINNAYADGRMDPNEFNKVVKEMEFYTNSKDPIGVIYRKSRRAAMLADMYKTDSNYTNEEGARYKSFVDDRNKQGGQYDNMYHVKYEAKAKFNPKSKTYQTSSDKTYIYPTGLYENQSQAATAGDTIHVGNASDFIKNIPLFYKTK